MTPNKYMSAGLMYHEISSDKLQLINTEVLILLQESLRFLTLGNNRTSFLFSEFFFFFGNALMHIVDRACSIELTRFSQLLC